MEQFTAFKPAWHLDKIASLRKGKDIIPTHLQLIISDLCNQDCHFCAYRMEGGFSTENFPDEKGNKNPVRYMPTAKAKEILTDAYRLGTRAVEFTGGGEPTVHPNWVEIIEYAVELGYQVGLVTNGIRLAYKHKNLLSKLTWIRISLDAGTEKTYQAIRRHAGWKVAMQAIEFAGSLKGPLVGIGFVATKENYTEVSLATSIAKNAGAAYIRISAMFSMEGAAYYKDIYHEFLQVKLLALDQADERFQVIDFFTNRVEDLAQQTPDYDRCGYQQFVLYIGADQKVYTCCTNAYTTAGEIGNLKEQSFAQWIAEKNTRFLEFNAQQCHHCQFNDKNRIIEYLTESAPPHVNFV